MFDENKVITGCIKGDKLSQRLLFERYSGKMKVVCMRYSRDELEARSMMMDGFLKVYQNIDRFRKECPLEAWILRIMINTSIKHYRKRNKIYPVVEVDETVMNVGEDAIFPKYGYEQLIECIRQLPERYSTVFNLYAINGYSHKEISDMLGIPEGTSKSNLSRARVMLQHMVKKLDQVGEKLQNETTVR
ncbi:MAG: sigma-70 family RNA polymerase sigma factor [Bacteroidetes bacterium]|nr:sigma-70 family RNA polymerase sigma factor [Bacteroidota bacterium]